MVAKEAQKSLWNRKCMTMYLIVLKNKKIHGQSKSFFWTQAENEINRLSLAMCSMPWTVESFNTWLLFEGVKFRNTSTSTKSETFSICHLSGSAKSFFGTSKGGNFSYCSYGRGKKEAGTGMDGSYSSECYRHLSWDNYWKSRRCFCPNYCLKEPSFSLSSFPSCRHVCVQPSLAKYFSENIWML